MQDMDTAYANGAFIPGGDNYPAHWNSAAAAFRQGLGARARTGLRYGPGARNLLDLFLPEGAPKGLLIFIHGGYWLVSGRESWSHLAAGALARGWACVMPSYTLAPHARIADITREMALAVQLTTDTLVPGLPVTLTGHSAGGHLAARLGCTDHAAGPVRRVVPLSPLAELAPLMDTSMDLRLDAGECATESPARLTLRPEVSAHIYVGQQERPAFLWQARTLSESWSCPWTAAPGLHHYNVMDGLSDPQSDLTELCCGGI